MASGATTTTGRKSAPGGVRPRWFVELLLIAVIFGGYTMIRSFVSGHAEDAFRNAVDVWDLERFLRLPDEAWFQEPLLRSDVLVHAVNVHYLSVHFPASIAALLWLYWRRPAQYMWTRSVMAWLTVASLVVHVLYPLAPPRMLPQSDMVDTGQVYGPTGYSGSPETDGISNQFAAMPSLHVGWAVVIAIGLVIAGTGRWRWVWLVHPVLTSLVVVVTANHYWLDGIVSCLVLAVIVIWVRPPVAADPTAFREASKVSGKTG